MSTIDETFARDGDAPVPGVQYAQFHHNNFFTTRLEEMKAWYATVLGMTPTFEFPIGGVVVAGLVVYGFSRVMLAVPRNWSIARSRSAELPL